mgnify:CR=1 FL=1
MSSNSQETEITVKDVLREGEEAFAEGRLDDARKCFESVLSIDGAQPQALNNLAVLCHQSGDLDLAEMLFLRAAVLQSDPTDALVNLSAVAQHASRLPEAAAYLERALERSGETPRVLEQMSNLAEVMGDPITGKQLWQKARAAATAVDPHWKAAFCSVDITPDLSDNVELQGFFGAPRVAKSVASKLELQVALIEDGYRHRALFVGADVFGFGPEFVSAIRDAAAIWGIEPEAVILNASHTHYAPGTITHTVPGLGRFERAFATQVCAAITNALPRLYLDLAPTEISWGRAEGQIGFNRRKDVGGRVEMAPNVDGHYETETPILYLNREDGRRCLMVNHGCHPTGLGPADAISADYPGALRETILKKDGADVVMFLQGAAGNIKQGAQVGEQVGWISNHDDACTLGQRLADAVLEALPTLTAVDGSIRGTIQTVTLPLKGGPAGADAISLPEHSHVPRAILDAWSSVVEARYPGQPTGFQIEVTSLALGPVNFVALPGEPMAETANRIRQLSTRHDVVFCLGYTNGLAAYFPAEEMVEEGGYEAHMSSFVYSLPSQLAAGSESAILETSYVGSHAVSPVIEPPPAMPREQSDHSAFFVLSTGRSGTQTMAQMFKLATNAHVWHHPQPYMIMETQQAYWDTIDRRSIFWSGRGQIIREAWDNGLIHGETDHNMTPFCDVIGDDVPNSKFVILVRDPREFVRSGMRRNYYRGTGAWEQGRLRPQESDPIFEEWSQRSQFEQIAWLWAETYRHIESTRAKIGEDRVHVLRFEDLIAGPEATDTLFQFLGLDGYDHQAVETILGQKLNAQQVGDFPHPSEWSDELHAQCWAALGDIAEVYGYPEEYPKRRRGAA